MKIVLYQPQIPQNTGNILRTCAVTGSALILVPPLGFQINDRWMRRAGLDYWERVSMETVDDLSLWLEEQKAPFYFFSAKATKRYDTVCYPVDAVLIFGSETDGLPSEFWERWPDNFVTMPMLSGERCLNLATSVGIGVYEALRQNDFPFQT